MCQSENIWAKKVEIPLSWLCSGRFSYRQLLLVSHLLMFEFSTNLTLIPVNTFSENGMEQSANWLQVSFAVTSFLLEWKVGLRCDLLCFYSLYITKWFFSVMVRFFYHLSLWLGTVRFCFPFSVCLINQEARGARAYCYRFASRACVSKIDIKLSKEAKSEALCFLWKASRELLGSCRQYWL